MPSSDVLSDLVARGLLHDHTDLAALRGRLAAGPVTLYSGFDPTADSLHAGHLLGLIMLRRFQRAGHRPLALVGGATGMIGDPSGRSEERTLLDAETLARNVEAIKAQFERLLGPGAGDHQVRVVDNLDWTRHQTLIEFLRGVGKSVTVNQMVAKESVKTRMAGTEGISYTEFTYMLLQAQDFAWLYDHEGCELQIGGSDQWGNITAGVDLIRRRRGAAAHGLTWPLLTRSDGTKFGKTQQGALWLDPARTSPYRFYQHWIQTGDDDVERLLAQFTLLELHEVRAVLEEHRAAPQRRLAQRRLADELTTLVHGEDATASAAEASAVLFGGSPRGASEAALAAIAAEVPATAVAASAFEKPLELVELLVLAGLARSKGDARRVAAQGGAYLEDRPARPDQLVGAEELRYGRYLLLRRGKRDYAMVLATPG